MHQPNRNNNFQLQSIRKHSWQLSSEKLYRYNVSCSVSMWLCIICSCSRIFVARLNFFTSTHHEDAFRHPSIWSVGAALLVITGRFCLKSTANKQYYHPSRDTLLELQNGLKSVIRNLLRGKQPLAAGVFNSNTIVRTQTMLNAATEIVTFGWQG